MTRNERLCIVWKEKCRHAYLWIPTLPGRTEIESDSSASFLPSAKISGASDVPTLVGMQSLPCYPKSSVRWSAMLHECIRKMCITSKFTCEWNTSHCSTWCQTYTVDVGRYLANRTEIMIQKALNWIQLRLKKRSIAQSHEYNSLEVRRVLFNKAKCSTMTHAALGVLMDIVCNQLVLHHKTWHDAFLTA